MPKKLSDVQKMDIEVGWRVELIPDAPRRLMKVVQNWSARGWGFRLNYTRTEILTEQLTEENSER